MSAAVTFPIPPVRSGVYLLKREGRVVYVGQSTNIFGRLQAHALTRPGDEVEFYPAPVSELDAKEKAAIEFHQPEFDKAGLTHRFIPCRIQPSRIAEARKAAV